MTLWEKALDVRDDRLRELRARAMAESAEPAVVDLMFRQRPRAARLSPAAADLAALPPATARRRRGRAPVLCALLTLVVAIGALAAKQTWSPWRMAGANAPAVRMGFETSEDGWSVLYGAQVARAEVTSKIHAEGARAMLVTVLGASADADQDYSAVGVSRALDGLRAGSRVTLKLWAPGPQPGAVRFLVRDSQGRRHWALGGPSGQAQQAQPPLPAHAGWTTFHWTVPAVDSVTTIGMQIWSPDGQPLLVGIDAVSW